MPLVPSVIRGAQIPTTQVTTVFSIDTSDFNMIAENIKWMQQQQVGMLRQMTSKVAKRLAEELAKAAPQSGGQRYYYDGSPVPPADASKLNESFRVTVTGPDTRAVVTLAPRKFSWTNYGTQPPTFGTGTMFPRKKKALWWPGAAHPVWMMSGLPGRPATYWADAVLARYVPGSITIPESAQYAANEDTDWWVETFTNLNKRRKSSVVRQAFEEILARRPAPQYPT